MVQGQSTRALKGMFNVKRRMTSSKRPEWLTENPTKVIDLRCFLNQSFAKICGSLRFYACRFHNLHFKFHSPQRKLTFVCSFEVDSKHLQQVLA